MVQDCRAGNAGTIAAKGAIAFHYRMARVELL